MKKVIKTIILILIALIIQSQMTFCYADGDNPIIDPDAFRPRVSSDLATRDNVRMLLGVIRNIGIMVAVISLMIIGLKYMLGSAEQKAEYKKVLPGYGLGLFMVLAITTIPSIIYSIMKNV